MCQSRINTKLISKAKMTSARVSVQGTNLFTITNCLYHLWLEIHVAKITTMVDQVLDVFYVTDNEGRKIEDAERLEIIRRELLRALEQASPEPVPAPAQAAGA